MEIKPETVKKVAYPALAAVVTAVVFSSCDQQVQGGIRPVEYQETQQ